MRILDIYMRMLHAVAAVCASSSAFVHGCTDVLSRVCVSAASSCSSYGTVGLDPTELVALTDPVDVSVSATCYGITRACATACFSSCAQDGSNGWAVSGKFTKTGMPLLAGDPHIEVNAPGSFIFAVVSGQLH